MSQELISALINVTRSIHNRTLTDESYTAIELIVDRGGVTRWEFLTIEFYVFLYCFVNFEKENN